jgi:hypothetical protein
VVLTLAPEAGEGFFPVDRFHVAALEVIVTAVERFAYLGQLLQISGHRVFDEVVGGTAGFGSQLLQSGLGFWPEIYFHIASLESGASCVKKLLGFQKPQGHSTRIAFKLPRPHAF